MFDPAHGVLYHCLNRFKHVLGWLQFRQVQSCLSQTCIKLCGIHNLAQSYKDHHKGKVKIRTAFSLRVKLALEALIDNATKDDVNANDNTNDDNTNIDANDNNDD